MISPADGEVQEMAIADDEPTPDEAVLREEFRQELHAALGELPCVYRDAIVMCDIDFLSYSEIATLQGTTIGTVRSRIHRGRRLLRDIMVKNGAIP